jgi:hypothetical protein
MAKAVGTIVGATVGFFVGGPVGLIVGAGLGYAGGGYIDEMLSPPGFDMPVAAQQNQQFYSGVTINKQGTDVAIPIIYGDRFIGGARVFVATSSDTEMLNVKLVLCEGPIRNVGECYVDDVKVRGGTTPISGNKFSQYSAKELNSSGVEIDSWISPISDYRIATGFNAQGMIGTGTGWTSAHMLSGLAAISLRFRYFAARNQADAAKNPFTGMPKVTALVFGRRLMDLEQANFWDAGNRTIQPNADTYYLTNGAQGFRVTDFLPPSGDQNIPPAANETGLGNLNPVNALFDYLTNKRYGKGLPLNKIDLPSFVKEAKRWYRDANGNLLPPELQQYCNAIIDTERTIFENVENMLFNMGASMPYVNGKFTLRLEDNRNNDGRWGGAAVTTMDVNESNIINGSISIEADSVQSKYNRINVTYPGGDRNQQAEVFWPEPNSALEAEYLAEDNGRINELKLNLEHITQPSIALHKAKVALAKSRFRSKSISFTGDASLHQVTINDLINFQYSPLGISGVYRIQSIQFNPDYTFSVSIEEHTDSVYGQVVEAVTPTPLVRVGSGNVLPIYVKNSDPQVVWVGEIDRADNETPLMSNLIERQDEEWQDYIETNFVVATNAFTKTQLEEGIADGTITEYINGDILIGTDTEIKKPVITGAQLSINSDNSQGRGDIIVSFTRNSNSTIITTKLLMFDYQQRSYKDANTIDNETAAARGNITIKNAELGLPIKVLLLIITENSRVSSDPFDVNLQSYYEINNIQSEFLNVPLYTLNKGSTWVTIDNTFNLNLNVLSYITVEGVIE